MITIAVSKHPHNFCAEISGHAELCGHGQTESEAIGNLILSHPQIFPIDIIRPGERRPKPRPRRNA